MFLDFHKDPSVREDRRGPNLWCTGYSFKSSAGQLRWQSEPLKASEMGKMYGNMSRNVVEVDYVDRQKV